METAADLEMEERGGGISEGALRSAPPSPLTIPAEERRTVGNRRGWVEEEGKEERTTWRAHVDASVRGARWSMNDDFLVIRYVKANRTADRNM